MKKFLALFLVMAMLLSSLALLSSCKDSVDKSDVEDDPYTTLMKASRNTINNFFVIDDDAKEIINNAAQKGAYTIKLSNSDDLDMPFDKMSSTVYMDVENKSFVYDSSITMEGQTYTSRFYMNKDTMATSNNQIDRTLKIDFETLIAELKTSALMEMIGLNEDKQTQEYIDMLIDAFKDVQKSLKESYADSLATANEYIEIFMGEISETEIKIDGEAVNCIKMPFTFNSKNIKKFINKAIDSVDSVKDVEEFDEYKSELLNQVEHTLADAEVKIDIYINKDTTSFAKISVKAELGMLQLQGDKAPVIEGEIFFAETRIVFDGSVEMNDQKFTLNAEITKETEDDETTFDFSAALEMTRRGTTATMKLAEGTIKYDKDSGDVKIVAEIPEEDVKCTVKANFKVDGEKATLTLKSFSLEDSEGDYSETYKFNIQYVIDADANVPSIPKNATDIMDLSEEDWMELEEELNGMSFVSLFVPQVRPNDDYFVPDFDEPSYTDTDEISAQVAKWGLTSETAQ